MKTLNKSLENKFNFTIEHVEEHTIIPRMRHFPHDY